MKKRRTQAKSRPTEYLTILKNGWPCHYKLKANGQLELQKIDWGNTYVPIEAFKPSARQNFELQVRNAITYDWLNFD